MKKDLFFIFSIVFFLFFSIKTHGQVSTYAYNSATTSYTSITGGTQLYATSFDDGVSGAITIPSFIYNCTSYTTIYVSTNGFITFGSAPTSIEYTPISGSTGYSGAVSAFGCDLNNSASGTPEIRYQQMAATNEFVIQWQDVKRFSSVERISFQIRLNYSTNVIRIFYGGTIVIASGNTQYPQVGLRGASNTDFNNRTTTNNWSATTAGGANNATCTYNSPTGPAAGLTYTYSPTVVPSVPGCATLTTPADGVTGQSKCNPTISWTAPASSGCNAPTKYYVYFGIATNPALFDSTTTTSYQLGVLNSTTQYFWRVIPKNNAGLATGCTTEFDFTTSSTACSVSPGGVGTTNLTAWFKADALAAGNVTSWAATVSSLGGVTVTDAASPYPQSTNSNAGSNNLYNYNQYVSFAGNVAGSVKVLTNSGSFALCPNSTNAADQSSFFSVFSNNPTAGTNNDNIVIWRNGADASGSSGIQCRGLGTGVLSIGDNTNGTNASRSLASTNMTIQQVASYTGNESSSTSMTGYWNGTVIGTNASGVASAQEVSFGGRAAGSELFEGNASENIFLNTTLSTSLVNRVHTYLAIKYGITLSTHYYATNGSTIYARTGTYTNNIIGIGRDDITALLQKQSHNTDDTVRIYKGTLSTTNAGNAATFAADQSYVVIGANTGKLCNTAASLAEKPAACGLYSRLEREWKVTNTNFAESFNMNIKLNACAVTGSVTVAHLRLLVDDDGNFGNGGTTCYANGDGSGIAFTYSNPLITITGISNTHIASNATKYITVGSVNALTPLPVELLSFAAKCVDQSMTLNWSTASETNNHHFDVQRSNDGVSFNSIALIAGHGNSTTLQQYQYVDVSAPQGNLYYRLKQVDTDLSEHYHQIISIVNECSASISHQNTITVYPNPNNGNSVQLGYTVQKNEEAVVKFYDVLGKIIFEKTVKLQVEAKETTLQIADLAQGIYFIQIESIQFNNKPIKFIKE